MMKSGHRMLGADRCENRTDLVRYGIKTMMIFYQSDMADGFNRRKSCFILA